MGRDERANVFRWRCGFVAVASGERWQRFAVVFGDGSGVVDGVRERYADNIGHLRDGYWFRDGDGFRSDDGYGANGYAYVDVGGATGRYDQS